MSLNQLQNPKSVTNEIGNASSKFGRRKPCHELINLRYSRRVLTAKSAWKPPAKCA